MYNLSVCSIKIVSSAVPKLDALLCLVTLDRIFLQYEEWRMYHPFDMVCFGERVYFYELLQ